LAPQNSTPNPAIPLITEDAGKEALNVLEALTTPPFAAAATLTTAASSAVTLTAAFGEVAVAPGLALSYAFAV
jgi:hypothetical protein